ncbi:HET-domain-containing protein [Acephala macrosclerotiorum]|nr:HET-domain-containing protein [Acephala macrosclerotiorum]
MKNPAETPDTTSVGPPRDAKKEVPSFHAGRQDATSSLETVSLRLKIAMLIQKHGGEGTPRWSLAATIETMQDEFDIFVNFNIQPLTSTESSDVVADVETCTSSPTSWTLIEEWIRTCNESHSLCSAAIGYNSNWYPTRLLYANETSGLVNMVVTADASMARSEKYVTLSHCWGKEQQPLRLLKNNMHELKKDIALHTLPKTFQDVVLVAKKLHMRYIWIDSLCIIQDDEDDWHRESTMMHEVSYSMVDKPGTAYELLNGDFWEYSVSYAPLNRRAWVCQERLLALRNVHFGKEQMLWECRELNAAEKFPHGLLDDAPDASYFNFKRLDPMIEGPPVDYINHPEPQDKRLWVYAKWQYVIESYSRGLLTKPEDKLAAISGIAERFKRILQDEHVVGMWRRYLPSQLLWYQGKLSKFIRPKEYRGPSFSWIPLDGEITAPSDISDSDIVATVLDVSIETNTTGMVTGGYITISALMAIVTVNTFSHGCAYIRYVNNRHLSEEWLFFPDDDIEDDDAEDDDAEDDDTEDSDTEDVSGCKYYINIRQSGHRHGEGLILEYLPGTRGHYKRVSYAWYNDESLFLILKEGAMSESVPCKEYDHKTGHHTILRKPNSLRDNPITFYSSWIPIDSGLIFCFAGSASVRGREQQLLYPELRVSIPEPRVIMPEPA